MRLETAQLRICICINVCIALVGCSKSSPPTADAAGAADAAVSSGSAEKAGCKVDRRGDAISEKTGAIVGGSPTPYPSVPLRPGQEHAVGGLLYNGSGQQGCSATLVADKLVLTAGHCATNYYAWDGDPATVSQYLLPPGKIQFGIGSDLREPLAVLDVEEVHVHPQFQMTFGQLENDVAVLVLKTSAAEAVPGTLPIPVNDQSIASAMVGKPLLQGGFGSRTCGTYRFSPERFWAEASLTHLASRYLGWSSSDKGSPSMGDSGAGVLLSFPDGLTRVVSLESLALDTTCKDSAGPRLELYQAWIKSFIKDPCGTATAAGSCSGAVATYCQDGRVVSEDCGKASKVCSRDLCGLNRCVVTPASVDPRCQGLDYFGRCTDSGVAEWCVDGEFRRRDCAALGQSCGKSVDSSVGLTCLKPGTDARGDASVDAGRPSDASQPTGSCSSYDTCMDGCQQDFWCKAGCAAAATSAAKLRWSKWAWCYYCAYSGDATHCDGQASFFGVCKSDCASRIGGNCDACIDKTCKSFADECAKG